MAWLDDVRRCVQALPPQFHLNDAYAFAADLGRGRANNNIPAKIRQQIQALRDSGFLHGLGHGWYRHASFENASIWPYRVGDVTTRADLCKLLGLKQGGLNRKGMHKNTAARGRFSRDLLLLHEAGKNPYQDRWVDSTSMVWIGMGTADKGDQKFDGFNRYLAEHAERGIRVHLFVQGKDQAGLEYYGEVTVTDYRWTFREDERRHVLEYDLAIGASLGDRSELGTFYAHSWERPPAPYTVAGDRRLSPAMRVARNRAFGARLREVYRNQCAVCGDPLVGRSTTGSAGLYDLQGAHVRAVHDGGPDEINNGLCLCARHHWAFDHGVFSVGRDYEILLSEHAFEPHGEIIDGEPLGLPKEEDWAPHQTYMAWHRTNWQISS